MKNVHPFSTGMPTLFNSLGAYLQSLYNLYQTEIYNLYQPRNLPWFGLFLYYFMNLNSLLWNSETFLWLLILWKIFRLFQSRNCTSNFLQHFYIFQNGTNLVHNILALSFLINSYSLGHTVWKERGKSLCLMGLHLYGPLPWRPLVVTRVATTIWMRMWGYMINISGQYPQIAPPPPITAPSYAIKSYLYRLPYCQRDIFLLHRNLNNYVTI